ncbi:MAG: hypothetical protein PHG85_00755 [Candidatus Altiarchaeota archaeon]|nr:hypothetical protein [Candidatus Altiarchaeota archaeon]
MKYKAALGLIVLLALLETALIFMGVLPPLSENNTGNAAFIIAKLGVIAYAAWTNAREGFRTSFTAGFTVSVADITLMCMAIGMIGLANIQSLGLPLDSAGRLLAMLAITFAANAMLMALVVGIIALAATKVRKAKKARY